MLSLPFPPRKAHLRSFWLVVGAVISLVIGTVIALLAGPFWGSAALLAGALLVLAGLRLSDVHLSLYKLWNRGAAKLAKVGYRWTLYLTHRLLLTALGSKGSRFDGSGREDAPTNWTPFAYHSARKDPIDEIHWTDWSSEYTRWARQPGNRWGLLIWPLLVMMSLFRDEDANASVPSNIYTLF